jgi:hypothetical protein
MVIIAGSQAMLQLDIQYSSSSSNAADYCSMVCAALSQFLPYSADLSCCFRSVEVRGCCAAAQTLSVSLSWWNAGSHASSNSIQQLHQQDVLLLRPFQGFAAHYAKGKGCY